MRRFAAEPPPPPRPKPPALLIDWPKRVELRLPTGTPALPLLKRFCTLTEKFRL